MGKAHTIQSNFTGGEVDPSLKGRVDVARYKNGVETLKNAYVLTLGGAKRRPGTRFIENEGASITVRLIPFHIYRTDTEVLQGYQVELRSDNTIHFYTNGARVMNGGSPVSIASPFTGVDLKTIKYDQTKDTLYLVHPDFPPQQLVRASDTSWTISAVLFNPPAVLVDPADQSVTAIWRSGTTVYVQTAQAHGMLTGLFVWITGCDQAEYNGKHLVFVTNSNNFEFEIPGAPATPATGTILMHGIIGIVRTGSTAKVSTPIQHGFTTGDYVTVSGASASEYNGTFQITYLNEYQFTYTVTGTPSSPALGTLAVQRVYWGADPIGYPSCITFYEQRMLLGGSKSQPTTIWGSESGSVMNFNPGTGDSDSFEFRLATASSGILHLSAFKKQVFINTHDKELSIAGGASSALSPSNVEVTVHTNYGCKKTTRPLMVGGEFFFATKHGKRIRSLSYRFEKDDYGAADLSMIAAHLSASGVVAMAFAVEPLSVVWVVTVDGKLLSISYDSDNSLVAWAQHTTDGLFKDVSVVAYNGEDQVWVVVDRVIGGVTNTILEVLDSALNTDAAVTGTDGPGKATWTGLDHLNGKTVDILADGVVMPQQVVASGQVTLPRNANAVEIGLHYETEIKDLPPDLATTGGTTQGQAVSVNKAIVRLHESKGCEINGEVIPFRRFGLGILDQEVEAFSGDKAVNLLGWESKGVVTIKQTQPLPLTVLAIIKEVTING